MTLKIVHLLDDTTAGGVTRMLEHITTSPQMARSGDHQVHIVRRHRWSSPSVEADVIVSHLSISWKNMPMLIALRATYPGVPLVHVEHSYSEGFVALNVSRQGRFSTLLRISYSLFDRVIAVSRAQGKWLERRQLVDPVNLAVIPSVVDLGEFLSLHLGHKEGPVIIGAIGRLDRQKGFDVLIPAFKQANLDNTELHIVGDGPERATLRELADGDSRIIFNGFTDDPAKAMATFDLVAMPSRWEPYGLVALEAQAAGRTVLCTQIDGLRDHISAGAIAVGANTVEAWCEALKQSPWKHQQAKNNKIRMQAKAAPTRFAVAWDGLMKDLMNDQSDLALAS